MQITHVKKGSTTHKQGKVVATLDHIIKLLGKSSTYKPIYIWRIKIDGEYVVVRINMKNKPLDKEVTFDIYGHRLKAVDKLNEWIKFKESDIRPATYLGW